MFVKKPEDPDAKKNRSRVLMKFVSMFLGEMTKVKKPSIIYEDNKGAIFLAKNRQIGICTKQI